MDQPRYYSFSRYLRRRFGCRVQKVTLHAGFTCPNRDGRVGYGGCAFCNNAGFSPNLRVGSAEVGEQLARGIEGNRGRRIGKFIAYFQAYTNTYAPVEELRVLYDEVWKHPEVAGLAIGTRPDCVDDRILDLIVGYLPRGMVWIEYGLQSAHDKTLELVNRGHDYACFEKAVLVTSGRGIEICAHTILGLPGEDREMMLETHRRLARLPIKGIKIHLLHIMKNTVMARQYAQGGIRLLTRGEYVSLVCDVLEQLPPTVAIQRMHADAPGDILVAPDWCLDKAGILEDIRREQLRRDSWQGKALGFSMADIPSVPPTSLVRPAGVAS
ncbi:MAG TPA: TIGR01212 family radical SAM protein [Phycisphaerae bacterium]|nr:TIGR01212 family radical SAM protein [Phycisphaerae bacterium]HRY67276.1 TIGR01212 family radical SAM protein [Phycisphaerae bacterium]HSA26354.1 TIGR01212 family radical SAM protein [Phycisphaerae bacterium]